jgi:hypothetical protein
MFLPWRGLFEQMKLADFFVFYDDVQLPHGGGAGRGFITRVQIKARQGQQWLALPILRSGRGAQLIGDAQFVDLAWKPKHLAAIRASYASCRWYDAILAEVVQPIYACETLSLSEFCITSMRLIAGYLGVCPTFRVSSETGITQGGDPSLRLVRLCQQLDATEYITGHGAADYLNHELFEQAGIRVAYLDYRCTPYPQRFGPFTPYVSILDLLFNVGPRAREFLDSGVVDWRDWLHK